MGNIPIKWKKITIDENTTEGKVEVNGPDNRDLGDNAPSLKVYGNEEVTGKLSVGGNSSVTGNLSVTGTTTATGKITANGGITGTLTGDASTVSGGYTVKTNVPSGAVFTDTKNTAGSTNNTGKLFLVGALEQSANPQTYSNSNCYIKSHTLYARAFHIENYGINIGEFGPNDGAGALLVNDRTGGYSIWMSGSSGMICGKDFRVLEIASGASKNRVASIVDTTDHFGITRWYQGDNVPRVEITGEGYLRSTNGSFDVINSAGSPLAYISGNETSSSLMLYSYDAAALSAPKLQVQAEAGATGGEIILFDGNNNSTITLVGETGTIVCNKMSSTNNKNITFSKSSGSWTFRDGEYTRSGQGVQIRLAFHGGNSNVSVGSNAIQGTVNDIPLPSHTVRLFGYYSSTVLMGELTDSGGFNIRVLGAALQLSSSNSATLSGSYIVQN